MPPIENCTVNDKAVIRLPNGELVHIGDIIYSDDNFGTPLGTLEGDNRTHIMIRNDKKELVAIPRKSEKGFRLATLPFKISLLTFIILIVFLAWHSLQIDIRLLKSNALASLLVPV